MHLYLYLYESIKYTILIGSYLRWVKEQMQRDITITNILLFADIKEIDSMFPQVCTVIDHRTPQKCGSRLFATFFSYHILMSFVI